MDSPWTWSRPVSIVLAVVLTAAVVLRFVARADLWLDEALTVNIAELPLGDLRAALRRDGAPPLHYFLLGRWIDVFGSSDAAVRALSGVLSLATVPPTWFVARRIGGARLAWIAAVVLATNPFAIRYATETRMYALEMLLVTCGILAMQRAWEHPTVDRLAAIALIAALLAYTQYWTLYLLLVTGATCAWIAWRGTRRDSARRTLGALAVGGVLFAPWLPTFLYQAEHTGTPWGAPVLPGIPIGLTFLAFGGEYNQEGWIALLVLVALVIVGTFGTRVGRDVVLDPLGRPDIRPYAAVGAATLVAGTTLAYVGGTAFQPRYSAVVLPFFVLVVARGLAVLPGPRLAGIAMGLVVVLGLIGGVRSAAEERTQAGEVVDVLEADAAPGDLVVLCPDQLGPAVARLAPRDLDLVTYPTLGDPRFVDWVDYEARLDATDPRDVATRVLARAGDRTVWLVRAVGYRTHEGTCELLSDGIGAERGRVGRVEPGDVARRENMGLEEFPAP
ncbi:MAG TPA: glycosyltransferase family 39 protein [Acidimicrobiia bacterium]|nr:glycosyltransferase family 39 protein [Acidimicrobiia bacterium]